VSGTTCATRFPHDLTHKNNWTLQISKHRFKQMEMRPFLTSSTSLGRAMETGNKGGQLTSLEDMPISELDGRETIFRMIGASSFHICASAVQVQHSW
jgi:hypothetical protein